MPWRPANIAGLQDALQTLNQLVRETNFRVDNLNATQASQGHRLIHRTTLTFGAIGAGAAVEVSINFPGANTSGAVSASPAKSLGNANFVWSAYVPTTNTVAIRVANPTAGSLTPNAVIWNIAVHQ